MVKERYKYLLEFMDNEVSFVYFNMSFFFTNFSDENILWTCTYSVRKWNKVWKPLKIMSLYASLNKYRSYHAAAAAAAAARSVKLVSNNWWLFSSSLPSFLMWLHDLKAMKALGKCHFGSAVTRPLKRPLIGLKSA